jgi:hypothetical protein
LAFALNAPVLCVPDVAWAPDHDPDAVQAVALVAVHVSVDVSPDCTLVGDAANVSVGAGSMATDTDCVADPPLPLQINVYVVFDDNAPVLCVPDVPLLPDQPPDAVQLVAFVVLHVNCEGEPEATLVGAAVNVSVGALAAAIDTATDFVTEPPAPEQASV